MGGLWQWSDKHTDTHSLLLGVPQHGSGAWTSVSVWMQLLKFLSIAVFLLVIQATKARKFHISHFEHMIHAKHESIYLSHSSSCVVNMSQCSIYVHLDTTNSQTCFTARVRVRRFSAFWQSVTQ